MTDPSLWRQFPPSDAVDHARADQDARWRAGHPRPVEEYLAALPAVAADPELALVLIYGEVLARTERGEQPALAEYAARFPHLADRLAVQFLLHSALGQASTGDPAPATGPGAAGLTDSLADPAATTSGPADGIAAATPPAPTARYELGAEVARGGMGAVYRATDTAFGREVAVKVLLDKYAPTSGTARRFADEARISGQLQHPNIPAVHDLGTLPDGRPFLAMKLIKGETLDALLKGRSGPADDRGRFVAVFEQVCQAVAYAHAHRVIHRDLKPGNVMVGAFGEVQVMDWGLAKVLGGREAEGTDPDATAAPTEVRSLRQTDSAFTQDGSVLGTPAYMPPEQAVGAVHKVDARSDVFGLGAILAVILTGRPPFVGESAATTRLKAAQWDVEECFARLDGCGAEPELVALCKRCLSRRAEDRPADAGEVAKAVAALRAAADERARKAETERARAETQAVEQRKRRRVQLALAGMVLVVAVGGGIAAVQVQRQRDADGFAAEKKRLDDLRAAEEEARVKQLAAERQTRAVALVDSLGSAETPIVPRIITDLAELKELARPKLAELAAQPITSKPGLHARLALLPDEPERAGELAAYLPECKPEELLTIRGALTPHAAAVSSGLWDVLLFPKADRGQRVRAAGALAGLTPDDPRWRTVAVAVAEVVVKATPAEFVVWSAALEPVRGSLLPGLAAAYPQARDRIRSGKVPEGDLGSEAAAFEFTANLLARYTADCPAELAELAVTVDVRHYPLFGEAIRKNRAAVIPRLKAELARDPGPVWAVDGGGVPLAAVVGGAVAGEALDPDPVLAERGKRKGYAAAALLALGEAEAVWPVFRFPADGDPTARSYLLERLGGIGADPAALVTRFEAENDVSAKRAVLIALGDFPPELVPDREVFATQLLTLYREHPDAGLHSAIDWLLRQKWGKRKELAAIDAGLTAAARLPVVARRLADVCPLAVSSLLPAPAVAAGWDWYVNGEGQTYAVIRDPAEFTLGSPVTEPGRNAANEQPHRKRIGRTYAIATREVTNAEFLRFRANHNWTKRFSPGPDTPAVIVTLYDAAAYCNWLSAREGIPADQWCYEPIKAGEYGEEMRMKAGHLKLTGYRLQTEAEWECACRGGVVTARPYGRGEELLPRYGWFVKTSDDRVWPVAQLRPTERGLFDALGNAMEWVEDPALLYVTGRKGDVENGTYLTIDERMSRLLRGGSFVDRPVFVRSAVRVSIRPGVRDNGLGFRPVRTLSSQ